MWVVYFTCPQNHQSHSRYSGSRDVLEAYWEIIGGKPVQKTKRRGRPASGSVKKKLTVKSAADGSDEWLPPVPSAGNWDALVQDVETVDKDEKGALWAYLLWSEKKKDGGPIRNKAPVRTCYKACPQKVRARSICHRLRFWRLIMLQMLKFYEKHLWVACPSTSSSPWLFLPSQVSCPKAKPYSCYFPILSSTHK